MKKIKLILELFAAVSVATFTGCGDDDEGPASLTIVSLAASGTDVESGDAVTGIDLNGTTSAEKVPTDLTISVEFSRNVDATSVSSSAIELTDGTTPVSVNASVNGAVVTLTPTTELIRGTNHTISLMSSIVAEDGGTFESISRSFKTGGRLPVVPPNAESQIAYWKFDGDATEENGNYDADAVVNIEFATDRFGQAGGTAKFDGDASIIEVNNAADLMVERSGWTISLWMKIDTLDNLNAGGTGNAGQFVFGLGAFFGFRMETKGTASNFSLANRWEIAPEGEEPITRNEGF